MTGEITLKPKASEDQRKRNLQELFRLIAENPFTEDFIPERVIEESRNPFEEWAESTPAKESKARFGNCWKPTSSATLSKVSAVR